MKNEFPIDVLERDYKRELTSTIRLQFWLTITGSIVGFIVFTGAIFNVSGYKFPKMRVGDKWFSCVWFIGALFLIFTMMAIINILRMKNKRYNPREIASFYGHGMKVTGIYLILNGGKRTERRFYDKELNRYEIYTPVPHRLYGYSTKPFVCKAFVLNNTALIYSIKSELKGYRSSTEYLMELEKKRKRKASNEI